MTEDSINSSLPEHIQIQLDSANNIITSQAQLNQMTGLTREIVLPNFGDGTLSLTADLIREASESAENVENLGQMMESNAQGRPLSHKCPKCPYRSAWRSCVLTHMKLKHSNERPWRCTQCTKCYKLKHHLKQHMETAHGVSPSQANRVTIKNENSELDSPSMNEGVKQFLKMTKDNNSGATTPLSGTLEALVHSAFGNGNHSMENGLHSPKMNNHLHNQSNPSSPRNCDENGEPRSKMPKLDSELMSIFTNSGVNSSALANQISSSLGLKVNIQDDDQNSEDGENNPMEMLQTAEEYANNVKQEALDMEMSGMNGLNENESHNHSQNGTIDIPTTLANLQSTPVSSLNSNFITTRIIPVTQASPKSSTKFNIAAIAQAAVKNAQKESVSTKEKNFKTNSAGVKGQYTCKYCSISFPDNILYGLHMGQHCVSEPFKCNICSYNCTDRYDFMFHFAMGRHEK